MGLFFLGGLYYLKEWMYRHDLEYLLVPAGSWEDSSLVPVYLLMALICGMVVGFFLWRTIVLKLDWLTARQIRITWNVKKHQATDVKWWAAVLSAWISGVSGGIVFMMLFGMVGLYLQNGIEHVQIWFYSDGLNMNKEPMWLGVIFGFPLGMGAGFLLWSYVALGLGLFSREKVDTIMGRGPSGLEN